MTNPENLNPYTPCPVCNDEFTIVVGPRDEFGNQDTDDCPCQTLPGGVEQVKRDLAEAEDRL